MSTALEIEGGLISLEAYLDNPSATIAIAVDRLLAGLNAIAQAHDIPTAGGVAFFHGLLWAVALQVSRAATPADRDRLIAEVVGSLDRMVLEMVAAEATRGRQALDIKQLH